MQTKLNSFQEACVNTAVGFLLSLLLQMWVVNPLYGLQISFSGNLAIVGIFTVASIVRGYVLRRIFNRKVSHG